MNRQGTNLEVNTIWKKIKTSEDSERLEKTYEKLQEIYNKDGLTQQILLFLKTIVQSKSLPLELKNFPLQRMLLEICKQFILNELEITM